MLVPLQVISETISRRVCPLYALHPQKGTLELVGTGIPLALPAVSCLITAAHIFDGTGNQLLRTMGTRSMIQLNGRTVAFTLGNLNEADLDLAGIEYVAKHQVFIGTRVGYAVQLDNLLRE